MDTIHRCPVQREAEAAKAQRFGEYVGKKRGGVRFTGTEDGGG